MRFLVIVPARGGSKGLPGKNLCELAGISLVGRAIRVAREALGNLLHDVRILVDTDCESIAAEGRRHGAWVPFLRPAELADDATPTIDNVLHAIARIRSMGWPPEWVILLQPTSPLRSASDVRECVELALKTGASVVSVSANDHPAEQTLRLADDGAIHWAWPDARPEARRQALPVGYRPNGAVYVTTASALQEHASFVVENVTRAHVMPPPRSIDVDTQADLDLAAARLTARVAASPLAIGGHTIGQGQRCFVIAEAGVNHDGDVARAHRLVDVAADGGADAVKFQTFEPDKLVSSHAAMAEYQVANTGTRESQAALLRKLVLPRSAYAELEQHARERGLVFMSTPFDETSADFLEELGVPAFKIGSGELTNHRLLSHVARKGKPVLLSTGMADLVEVLDALEVLRASGCSEVGVFHCVTSYPARPEDANLRALETLTAALHVPVGWSDHTEGIAVALAAVARGAVMVEKHVTTDRSLPGPDHKASLSPDEFNAMVRAIREVECSLGDGRKVPRAVELPLIVAARRSVHVARELPQGHMLASADLVVLRPGDGISAARLPALIGRTLARPVSSGHKLKEDDLA